VCFYLDEDGKEALFDPFSQELYCNEVETGGHGMMGWGPAASTLKDMPVRTQHARF